MFGAGIEFLAELAENNDKDWFAANKQRFERDLQAPALELVARMAPRLAAISPHFRAVGKGRGSSVSRIHRDTRFSSDKSPYKDWLGIHFMHASGREAPGFHVHLSPEDAGVGIGVWMLEPPALLAVRQAIADPAKGWSEVRAGLDAEGFAFIGESLQRVPKGFPADHPHAEDLRRKTFGAGRPVDPTLPADALVAEVDRGFRAGLPLVRFLCDALGLPV